MDYSKMTNEEFDDILKEIVHEMSAEEIFTYGEVNLILREELNNEILSRWETRQGVKDE